MNKWVNKYLREKKRIHARRACWSCDKCNEQKNGMGEGGGVKKNNANPRIPRFVCFSRVGESRRRKKKRRRNRGGKEKKKKWTIRANYREKRFRQKGNDCVNAIDITCGRFYYNYNYTCVWKKEEKRKGKINWMRERESRRALRVYELTREKKKKKLTNKWKEWNEREEKKK